MECIDQTNQNMTPSQKESLLWDQRLDHINMKWLKNLYPKPRSSNQDPKIVTKCKHVSTCESPLCAACQFGKQTKISLKINSISKSPIMILCQNDLQPGTTVFVD